ncbi:MAG: HlyD family efflux transporter periplasmic adaptor subunit, partial [Thermoanaerobacterium sp.]|nr:HlyD family efflux transporter periplasmic adaptor subunit [Thermoanaerobacterium sp.]
VADAMVINSPIDGKIDVLVKDGTRVPKGKEIAEVVSPTFDKSKLNELNSVNDKIQSIKDDKNANPYAKDIESINDQIDELNKEYQQTKDKSVLSSISQKIRDLTGKKEQIFKNGPSSIRNLDDLYSQKKQLEDIISHGLYKIYSPEAGVVSDYFDGYEEIFNVNKLFNITLNDINAIQKEPVERTGEVKQDEPILKLINNYDWYILSVLDKSQSQKLKEGNNVKIEIDNEDSQLLDGNIMKIYSISDNSFVVVIRMNDVYNDFYKKRKVKVNLTINNYGGFIVPNTAIVKVDGKYGVYKLNNGIPSFEEVDVKAQNSENAVVESLDGNLKMYDEILVCGKDYLKR